MRRFLKKNRKQQILIVVLIGWAGVILFFISQAFYYSKFPTENPCDSTHYRAKIIARWSVKRYNSTFYKFSYKDKEVGTRSWDSVSEFAKTVRLDDSVFKFVNSDSCYVIRNGRISKINFCE